MGTPKRKAKRAPAPHGRDRRSMKIGAKGRVVMPATLRRAMGWREGDRIAYEIEGGRVVIAATKEQIRRLVEQFSDPEEGADAVRELIARRRGGREL